VQHGVECMLVAAGTDAVAFWQRFGFGPPPLDLPAAWVSALAQQFGHSTVLFCDPRHEAGKLAQAIEQLVSRVNTRRSAVTKRQRH